ncbi:hypothetical protein BRDID11004_16190 [Bradyrhizobium diazoefficiens]|uniref:Superinfection immunity protein n=1 Tax=Bradyrhizobium diazoefficiens TaxID=1355477 RepID=A0A810A5A7_9BRAD|nr:superinfection immunity protein [Bradyrhizobium diazoefficiens]BBZ97469.1 hypothetical protein F07S3_73020 [Bradyrhizobium diazoefficiens]BCA15153.1 hypothetical protein BDHF08_70000 [Bradyrhizobium diazoefficiens]BCE59565.1 hypothetical protein XF5B_70770 [Bradyrhizobium diazoefficiens]BCE68248.1 hypothetical protein XF6B_70470 [Bradyrhizobium diazoefficiens]
MDGAIWILLGIGLVIYMAPSIVAAERRHHQLRAIVALNISAGAVVIVYLLTAAQFLPKDPTERLAALIAMNILGGSTPVGWVVALVWSLTETHARVVDQSAQSGASPPIAKEESRWLTLMKGRKPLANSD